MARATSLEARPAPAAVEAAQRVIVRDVLRNGPATSHEIAARIFGMTPYAASKRCSELVQGGILLRINRRRNPGTGRWAAVLAATDEADDFLRGYVELGESPSKKKRDRLARVLRAANAVTAAGKPIGDGEHVQVPMGLMVELGSALQLHAEVRR